MSGKWLLAAVTALFLAACARPKYVEAAASGPVGAGEQTAADCPARFQNSQNCLSWVWETKPTSRTSGRLVFKIYRLNLFDRSAVPVDPILPPSLLLWMPGMGHGSSPTQVTRLDVGTYRADQVFFVMPGEWELRFQLKDGATIQDEAVVNLVF